MSFPKPPKINPEKLDFSEFHPLMHRIGTAECRSYYGGIRRHLQLTWDFKWEMPARRKRLTHCLFGRHRFTPWFRGDGHGNMSYGGHSCQWCHKRGVSASPEE